MTVAYVESSEGACVVGLGGVLGLGWGLGGGGTGEASHASCAHWPMGETERCTLTPDTCRGRPPGRWAVQASLRKYPCGLC